MAADSAAGASSITSAAASTSASMPRSFATNSPSPSPISSPTSLTSSSPPSPSAPHVRDPRPLGTPAEHQLTQAVRPRSATESPEPLDGADRHRSGLARLLGSPSVEGAREVLRNGLNVAGRLRCLDLGHTAVDVGDRQPEPLGQRLDLVLGDRARRVVNGVENRVAAIHLRYKKTPLNAERLRDALRIA